MTDAGRRDRRAAIRRRTLLGAVATSTVGLAGCLADTEFEIADVRVPTDVDGPLAFEVDLLDPDVLVDSPGAFEVSVTNEEDGALELVSQGVRPFGLLELRADPDDHPGETWISLWSDAYAESDHVDATRGGNSRSADGEELVTPLEPGETVSHTYAIYGDEVRNDDATYELVGGLGDDALVRYRRPDEEDGAADENGGGEPSGTALTPGIEFRIETRSRLPFR